MLIYPTVVSQDLSCDCVPGLLIQWLCILFIIGFVKVSFVLALCTDNIFLCLLQHYYSSYAFMELLVQEIHGEEQLTGWLDGCL